MKARKIACTDGQCDNCGKALSLRKIAWLLGESTGCSKRCVEEDFKRDLQSEYENWNNR